MKRFLLIFLSICLLLPLSACGRAASDDLTAGLFRRQVGENTLADGDVCDASLSLFSKALRSTEPGENVLISPTSILYALAMTGAGAEGNTLAQLESALGCDVAELCAYLATLTNLLEREGTCHVANSVWIKDRLRAHVRASYLQDCTDYFDADVFVSPLERANAADVNRWIAVQTDGMIDKLLTPDDMKDDLVMILINTLFLDLKWQEPYYDAQIQAGKFTDRNGNKIAVDFLCSLEDQYLENEDLYGVRKPYKDGYSFVALLPRDGKDVYDVAASLTGEDLRELLNSYTEAFVNTRIPAFEAEYFTNLTDVLAHMGVTELFDMERANLHGIATPSAEHGNLYVSDVLHKTRLELTRAGTRAAAVTAVMVPNATGAPAEKPRKDVILDKPFFYMILDDRTGLPLFAGICAKP